MNKRNFSVLISVVMLPVGIWLGYRAFREYSFDQIVQSVAALPAGQLALAFGFTAASYACLTGFDALALRYVGRSLPYRRIALTSFVSLSIGHNVGVAALSSGALRYRFYSASGVTALDVGRIILFCGVTVGLGLACLAGIALLLRPDLPEAVLGFGGGVARFAGIACFAAAGCYVLLSWKLTRPLCIRGHEFRLPPVRLAAGQVILGTVNFGFVAAALHQLLAGAATYPAAVAAYALGNIAGLLSHVPGGIGVLEYVIAQVISQADVVGALIAFRIVYFLVPLMIGSTLLVIAELGRWRRR